MLVETAVSRMYFALPGAPDFVGAGVVASSTSAMRFATAVNSSAPKPRLVSAGVPRRTPLVYQAPFGSCGTELRFVTTPEPSRADSAWRPVSPYWLTSISTMWLYCLLYPSEAAEE